MNTSKRINVPLIVVIVIILGAIAVYGAMRDKGTVVVGQGATSTEQTYLSEKKTLEIAQDALKVSVGTTLMLNCLDFDGIREGGFVTYAVSYKPASGCPDASKWTNASVRVDLVTGTAVATPFKAVSGGIVTPSPATPVSSPASSNSFLTLVSPNGGQSFPMNEKISITYRIGTNSQAMTRDTLKELYLVDINKTVTSYLGAFNPALKEFFWNAPVVYRNGGLDMSKSQVVPGKYRILMVVRNPHVAQCYGCEPVADTIDGLNTTFENGVLMFKGKPSDIKLIATDLSDSYFTITQ